ncbi:DUF455 domain protein [Metarhizium album ARSEF 1941]|uniref:DUF455 domain protein n=1 Tax=Metarhizium album (strain ARSEF 1941) TaxID=1081103 RepID=A0A0B2WMS9_METAS|nr:DUF455 domain protein [Metarhizium album ARSEF 1941]KHN94777.1 DUF455 domain protein [Metarhizium album ARSEF 1941]
MVSQELCKDHPAAPSNHSIQPLQTQQKEQEQRSSQTPWSDELNDIVGEHVGVERSVPGNSQTNYGRDENVWDPSEPQHPNRPETESPKEIPPALTPGGNRAATNPFVRRKPVPQQPEAPVTEAFYKLNVNDADQDTNPWQQAVDGQQASMGHSTSQPRPVTTEGIKDDPWATSDDHPTTSQPNVPTMSPALISLKSNDDDDQSAWKEELHDNKEKTAIEPLPTAMADEILDQNVWDDLGAFDKGKAKLQHVSAAGHGGQIDDWSLIDAESSSNLSRHAKEDESADERPPLPARSTGLQQKWVPSRPPVDARAETYQVKNIQWHDTNTEHNPRTSPILIQNENGPCPLVALVNALTMTTPADNPDPALVQVLRSREQISLNLLLDAVFDELMSPRRTNSEDALPDVSDLYAFLQSLHTGMNVNPRFIPTREMVDAYKRTSLTHLDPSERGNLIPGTFENTMEMSLYAAFSIPLIHGWLPAQTEPAYGAMERQAGSYEDVQKLLFREEELEAKLSTPDGLTADEQQLYQDILTIKMFLAASATQLTAWGIQVIGKAMRPGTFAILFRNDHFSTLYCHPQTLQLLSLVTDAGYRTHDEVVWESLVDVNGERTEYLSGDYHRIGLTNEAGPSTNLNSTFTDHGGQWTTVLNKRGKARQQDEEAGPCVSQYEQEDRDLALALQLQEEEDQRHREEQARRLQERVLSEQYIEQQGHRPAPVNRDRRNISTASGQSGTTQERRSSNTRSIPVTTSTSNPRQSSVSLPVQQQAPVQQAVRPLVPPQRPGVTRRAESNGDDAPPSYEQAAQDAAYMPSVGHPIHSQSSSTTSPRQTSASVEPSASQVQGAPAALPKPNLRDARCSSSSLVLVKGSTARQSGIEIDSRVLTAGRITSPLHLQESASRIPSTDCAAMAVVESWFPPTRENWKTTVLTFQILYPVLSLMQLFISWYGMGKTSVQSRLNLPGRVAWMLMEMPGFTTVLYLMRTLPPIYGIDDLPWQNRVLAGLFVIHYIYRAVIFPLIQPSMSPIHVLVALMAAGFQVLNGISIGAWLAAYGPVTEDAWVRQCSVAQFCAGIAIFYLGLAANFFHDEELREIRRNERRRRHQKQQQQPAKGAADRARVSVEKHYQIPQAGLFKYMLYAHYFCEWVEWFGFLVAAGWGCVPAWTFLVNEVFAMLPRAVKGKRWYLEKFGAEKVGKRWAVVPGLV